MEGAKIASSIKKVARSLGISDSAFAGVGLTLDAEQVMILDDLLSSVAIQINDDPLDDLGFTFDEE